MERHAFDRQPGRAVIIDLSPPMDMGACVNIKQALSGVLSTLAHLTGPSRLPLLSVFVVRSYTECIYPLQPIRGNYARVEVAMDELASLARDLLPPRDGCGIVRTSLLDCVQEAVTQFKRHLQSLKQDVVHSSNCPSQIEVTILTSQSPTAMRSCGERIANHIELQHLKKIGVICISDPEKLVECVDQQDDGSIAVPSEPLSQMDSPSQFGSSILDIHTCDNDLHSVQMAVRVWLQDCSTDSEHLHINLPPPSSHHAPPTRLTIKCDLHDAMMHPLLLPSLTKDFLINTGSSSIAAPSVISTNSQAVVPIYKLDAVGFVKCDGICESVVYGLPVIVKPTVCWKLDWEELERNQQYFQALCLNMNTKDQALILSTSRSADSNQFLPKAHYLLLPSSSSSSLLLKSVAVNELMLPVDCAGDSDHADIPTNDVQDLMRDSLEKLDSINCYNPLSVSSNLYEAISHFSIKRGRHMLKPGGSSRGKGTPNRGRGGARYRGGEDGTSVKRKQQPQVTIRDINGRGSGNSVRPKRLRIMRDGFVHDNDHVAN